jgi:TonB family protein
MQKYVFLALFALFGCARKSEFDRRFAQASADLPAAVVHGEAMLGGNVRAARAAHDRAPTPRQGSMLQVAQIVEAKLPLVKRCYERAVQTGGAASGKAIVNISISTDGTVRDVRVDAPDYENSALPGCVSAAARRWTFPPAREARSVSYPFVFMAG